MVGDKGFEPLMLLHTGLNRASIPIRVIPFMFSGCKKSTSTGTSNLELTRRSLVVGEAGLEPARLTGNGF